MAAASTRLNTAVETNTHTQEDTQPPYHSSALQKNTVKAFVVAAFPCAAKFPLRCCCGSAPAVVEGMHASFYFIFRPLASVFLFSLLQYIIPLGVCAVSLSYRMRDPTAHGVKSLPCPTHTNKTINNSASSGSII